MVLQNGFIGFPHAKSIVVSGDIHGDIAPLSWLGTVASGLNGQATMRLSINVVAVDFPKRTVGLLL